VTKYTLKSSTDGTNWATVGTYGSGISGQDTIEKSCFAKRDARYLRWYPVEYQVHPSMRVAVSGTSKQDYRHPIGWACKAGGHWVRPYGDVPNSKAGFELCGSKCAAGKYKYFGTECARSTLHCQCANSLDGSSAVATSACTTASGHCIGPFTNSNYILGAHSAGSVYLTARPASALAPYYVTKGTEQCPSAGILTTSAQCVAAVKSLKDSGLITFGSVGYTNYNGDGMYRGGNGMYNVNPDGCFLGYREYSGIKYWAGYYNIDPRGSTSISGTRVCKRTPEVSSYIHKGTGVAGPHVWLNVYGKGVEHCYGLVMSDSRCAKDYFSYVPRGDKNCGCKSAGSGSLSMTSYASADYYKIETPKYCPVGAVGSHASNEGTNLQTLTYSTTADCSAACAANSACKHYTACPGDGNKCYLKTGTSKVADQTGVGRGCQMHFPCAGASYTKGALGGTCPIGTRLTSKAECKAAMVQLGLCASSEWSASHVGIPMGCSWRNSCGNSDMHWNTAAIDLGRSDMYPICKK